MISRVYIASPFRADTPDDRDRHRLYLFDACEDATSLGDAWVAPHASYTPHLDDRDPAQREQGLRMGLAWIAPGVIDVLLVYADLGISEGMAAEIALAESARIPVVTRSLPGWSSSRCPYRPDDADPFDADPFDADPTPDPTVVLTGEAMAQAGHHRE